MSTGMMLDRNFADGESLAARQYRNVPVQLAIQSDLSQNFSSIDLEPAIEIVQIDLGHLPRYPVEELRG